jgi:4-amino-4-deoxy-L-arabinose transferase-like glycosyltransferase
MLRRRIPDLPSMLALLEVYVVFLALGAAVLVVLRWWLRYRDPFNEKGTRSYSTRLRRHFAGRRTTARKGNFREPALTLVLAWAKQAARRHPVASLISAVTLARLAVAAIAPLTPQEAYYWTWSRFPDWSYFDHPPLVSYGIGVITHFLGQTAFGVKSAAVLWSLGWNLLWAGLMSDMFNDRRVVFWSLAALNLTLLYELYGIGSTPDGPLLFGWIGAIWAVWRASHTDRGSWWYVAGAFLGWACLGKYAGVLLIPVVGLYLLTVPAQRRWLKRPQPYAALLIAALMFSPVIIWNAQHDWASLAFQSTRRLGEMGGFKPRFFVLLVITQFLLLTPYLFSLSLGAVWRARRAWTTRRIEPQKWLLLLSALVPMIVFVAASFRTNAKNNWLIPAWWSLVILGMHHALATPGNGRWKIWGLASSALLLGTSVGLFAFPNLPLPGDLNIWSGWRTAAERVDAAVANERAQGHRAFVFSPNYKISSLLWFHRPSQERTYAQDIFGRPALQYDYFPRTDDLTGATGFLVLSDQAQSALDVNAVRPLFETLERVDVVEAGALGRTTRRIEVWRGRGYRGRPKPELNAAREAGP